ncbi:MAG: FISUMP domain-containing protein [Ignavibacteria bacterium]
MKRILFLVALLITIDVTFSQTMVIKKADGTYQEVPITTAVELSFYQPCPGMPTVTDAYDNKIYNTVQIGSQCWLKENLNKGTMVDSAIGQTDNSSNNIIEKYCYGNLEANCTTYGGLYQWEEAMAWTWNSKQGICPTGWHLPTKAEYDTLTTVSGVTATDSSGNTLKVIETTRPGTNTSGFSALFAGTRTQAGTFLNAGEMTFFWSYESIIAPDYLSAYRMALFNNNWNMNIGTVLKSDGLGFSVRCLKD